MSDLYLFLKQVVKKPKEMGAIIPSSKMLAQRMAETIPDGSGHIVEFGAGTGSITKAMVEAGIPEGNIHSFEVNEKFCDHLRQSFPSADIIQDRAENLGKHNIEDIKVIISGIPLLILDTKTQHKIISAAFENLRADGVYIQFTYGLTPPICKEVREELNLNWTRTEYIWRNFPPAISYTFYKKALLKEK